MAIRFCDGFDSYAATADLLKKYVLNSGLLWNATAGRNGGGAVTCTGVFGLKTFGIISVGSVVNGAFWFKATAKPSGNSPIMNIINLAATSCGSLGVNSSGNLLLMTSSAAVVATGALNICDGNWHWLEFIGNWISTGATHAAQVDGLPQYSGTFTVNGSGSAPLSAQPQGFVNGTQTFDDVIIYDNTGASLVTADYPLGPIQINSQRPASDSVVQFAPDTGSTNYTQINEVNGDVTHYVQDGSSGDQDLYSFDALAFSPAKIWGVMANAYLHNPGVGAINHNQVCKNASTTTTGTTTQTPITNPRVVQEPFVLDPNTGAAWASTAALNAAKFGIKVT